MKIKAVSVVQDFRGCPAGRWRVAICGAKEKNSIYAWREFKFLTPGEKRWNLEMWMIERARLKAQSLKIRYIPGIKPWSTEGLSELELLAEVARCQV